MSLYGFLSQVELDDVPRAPPLELIDVSERAQRVTTLVGARLTDIKHQNEQNRPTLERNFAIERMILRLEHLTP